MTISELKELLFEINNQEMTVRELRRKLFEINNQDQEITKQVVRKF